MTPRNGNVFRKFFFGFQEVCCFNFSSSNKQKSHFRFLFDSFHKIFPSLGTTIVVKQHKKYFHQKSRTKEHRCYRRSRIKITIDARSSVFEELSVLEALFIVPVFLLVPVASMTFSLLGSLGNSLNFVVVDKVDVVGFCVVVLVVVVVGDGDGVTGLGVVVVVVELVVVLTASLLLWGA